MGDPRPSISGAATLVAPRGDAETRPIIPDRFCLVVPAGGRRHFVNRHDPQRSVYTVGVDVTPKTYAALREGYDLHPERKFAGPDEQPCRSETCGLLRDLPAAWGAETPQKRNRLARLVFQAVEVADARVMAVVPQPDFAPFFVREAIAAGRLDEYQNDPEHLGSSNEVLTGRKRRGSAPRARALRTSTGLRSRPTATPGIHPALVDRLAA